jgi:deoxyribodipyrimidine photo-lyase
MEREEWTSARLSSKSDGSRLGWWGGSSAAEAFLDELITWRELGYNMSWQRTDLDQYESLPNWARTTLQEHAAAPRDYVYSLEEFAQAQTHDDLWNATALESGRGVLTRALIATSSSTHCLRPQKKPEYQSQ